LAELLISGEKLATSPTRLEVVSGAKFTVRQSLSVGSRAEDAVLWPDVCSASLSLDAGITVVAVRAAGYQQVLLRCRHLVQG
jgi:hypothetical protein